MVALPYLSAARFTGADAGNFLHNQLSADILALAAGQSTLACYCEPKGRVLALVLVCCDTDGFFVVMSSSLIEAIKKRLQMYVIRAKVEIEVLDEYAVAGLHADETLESGLETLTLIAIPKSPDSFAIINKESLLTADSANHKAEEQELSGQEAWKYAELQRGICWLGSRTSGEFLPQMLGFDAIGAVNYRKGCYPGQEIVARTHYLGKVKRHPRLLRSQSVIGPNQMEKIVILNTEDSFDAITVDSAYDEIEGNCLFVVTRMEPDQEAINIKYMDQTVAVVKSEG
jgi:folate-binding protein YgfZ